MQLIHINDCVSCSVYYLETVFGPELGKSFLQSSAFDARPNMCLRFRYKISSPKIRLQIFVKTSEDSEFTPTDMVVRFSNQKEVGTWSEAAIPLADGTIQLQLVADKTGGSYDVTYIMVDSMQLTTVCPNNGIFGLITLFALSVMIIILVVKFELYELYYHIELHEPLT